MPCVPKLFFDDGLIQSTHHAVSFILNTIDVLGSLSAAPATDRNDFLNLMVVSFDETHSRTRFF